MKCPQCGNEMVLDSHRKIPLNMCYNCGYIEGRTVDKTVAQTTNFVHMKGLNLNETAAFLASGLSSVGLDVKESTIVNWLMDPLK
ncbi:MAG: hypothetical protein K6C08_13150 [Oscillospiraceae bacterium]|nr:hypothetical protein [Oscillospiraceae bacterium]